jgi:non-specific serine/threonine protein kinase/serine/threonine-protein kinase
MDARWQRLKELFAEARVLPIEQRATWLAGHCGGDTLLRDEVERLLVHDARAEDFLEAPVLAPARPRPAVGTRLGRWRLESEIGHGGMGTVFRAVREEAGFRQEAALKLIRESLVPAEVLVRFEQERRILARLRHPGIALFLDGGATDDGLPWLAMEYVEGLPLDRYCQEHALGLRPRIELFRAVCTAVEYAHRNLVVHRDLKPANILVTSDGAVKLLDFGIAKLTEPGDDPSARPTATLLPALTPDYASPEQVRGEAVTTASDVYALGVVLYELLAGVRPYDVGRSVEELVRAVCDTEPPRPSTAARREAEVLGAHGRPRGLPASELSGDLDTIVLKALQKAPERRYGSVAALEEDLGRLLEGLPVRARPDTLAYRVGKFAGRHRVALASSLVAALSLLLGAGAALRQAHLAGQARDRAERRSTELRRMANALVFEVYGAIADVPGATSARELVLRRASEHLDRLAAEAPDDPALAGELAEAYHRLGDVLGVSGQANLGRPGEALGAHHKALALRERACALAPGDVERRVALTRSLMRVAQAETEVAPSLAVAQRAVAEATALERGAPAEGELRRLLADAHYELGSQHRAIGASDEALPHFREALGLYEALARAGDARAVKGTSRCHRRLAAILAERGDASALAHAGRSLELEEAELAAAPTSAAARRNVSVAAIQVSVALGAAGEKQAALPYLQRALALRRQALQADPRDDQARRDVASTLAYLGLAMSDLRAWDEAAAALEEALSIAVAAAPAHLDDRPRLLSALASVRHGQGRGPEAARLARESLALLRLHIAQQPENRRLRESFALNAQQLAGWLDVPSEGAGARPSRTACEEVLALRRETARLTGADPARVRPGAACGAG